MTKTLSSSSRIFGLLFLLFLLLTSTAFSVEPVNQGRRKFYDIAELIKLIERAREAGMSDEDLAKLEIRDGDKVINVMEYKAEFERLEKLKDERLRKFLSKKFLTVNDIFKELIVSEPETIKKLREELVSER